MRFPDLPFILLVVGVVVVHLLVSPYTKVEESFNIQAIHDMLVYGLPERLADLDENYDHILFPGAVPRTFVGALFVSVPIRLVRRFLSNPISLQIVARSIIAIYNGLSLLWLYPAVSTAYGRVTGNWFLLLLASQFHIMYYFARSLPNIYAFMWTNLALGSVIIATSGRYPAAKSQGYYTWALAMLTAAGVVFRSEIAVLVVTQTLWAALVDKMPIFEIVKAGVIGLEGGLALTVPIDSLYWSRLTWPELESFYFNTILGKSSEWGTSPFYYYFTNAIPRLLMNPFTYLVLIPIALTSTSTRNRVAAILVPQTAFVAVYSLLPHKEWRFIIYVIPAYTAAAAVGASWIWNRRNKSFVYRLLNFALIGSTILTFAASSVFLFLSSLNYPGGEAMTRLHSIGSDSTTPLHIYVDNLACQTGVTRFLEDRTHILNTTYGEPMMLHFDKTENVTALHDPEFWQQFDYVVVERPETVIGSWKTYDVVTAFDGWNIVKPGDSPANQKFDVVDREYARRNLHPHAWIQKWTELGEYMRQYTGGYWVNIKMSPKLKIMKKDL